MTTPNAAPDPARIAPERLAQMEFRELREMVHEYEAAMRAATDPDVAAAWKRDMLVVNTAMWKHIGR